MTRYDVVTPGEAQRVSFARIFYHMPPFVCESVDTTVKPAFKHTETIEMTYIY